MPTLAQMFSAAHLDFESLDQDTLRSSFEIELENDEPHTFDIYALEIEEFGERYARFLVLPFVEEPDTGYPAHLYPALLQLNLELVTASFALSTDGALQLIADRRLAHLDLQALNEVIQLLGDYVSLYWPKVHQLIR
jgi:hypothetical protein